MMNSVQNPAFGVQHSYPYGSNVMAQSPQAPSPFMGDIPQNQFQYSQSFPNNLQPANFAPHGQIPPHVYQQQLQQHQQQQQQQHQHQHQQQQQQHQHQHQQQQQQQQRAHAAGRPPSNGNAALGQGQALRQSPNHMQNLQHQIQHQGQTPVSNQAGAPRSNGPPTSMPQAHMGVSATQASAIQHAQSPSTSQSPTVGQTSRAIQQPMAPPSPQTAAREKERVTTLLEINSHLLQEVINLQNQGKAGSTSTQQSPTSPTSSTDPSGISNGNSLGEGQKGQPPSQEYADCIRRLHANLAYLAAIADAKKKIAGGALPAGPGIMIPPPHLTSIHDLYKRLNALFPTEVNHTTANKAAGTTNLQMPKTASPLSNQPRS